MNDHLLVLLIGLGFTVMAVGNMKYNWTPKKNAWWDNSSDGAPTHMNHRFSLIMALLVGFVFTLAGLGVVKPPSP